MKELSIDWNYPKPDDKKIENIWKEIQFERMYDFSNAFQKFQEKSKEIFKGGGISVYKYKIIGNKDFSWFLERNRFDEIGFFQKIFTLTNFTDLQKDFKIDDVKNFTSKSEIHTNILTLGGEISAMLYFGGAYKNVEIYEAYEMGQNLVKEEFQNRFGEVCFWQIIGRGGEASLYYWIDYIIILIDKRKYEMYFISILDTD